MSYPTLDLDFRNDSKIGLEKALRIKILAPRIKLILPIFPDFPNFS